MLFRDKQGKIIEICKKDYINDTDYYKAIMNTKESLNTKEYNNSDEFERITNLIKIK